MRRTAGADYQENRQIWGVQNLQEPPPFKSNQMISYLILTVKVSQGESQ